ILALPKWRCPGTSATPHLNATDSAMFICRTVLASMLQLVLGLSGLVGLVLRFIGPVAIAPTINLIGLSLFIQAGQKSGAHWGIAALTVCLILLFSQYLSKVNLPLIAYKDKKWKVFQYPLFKLFSVSALFGMCGAWLVCFLLTYFNALPSSPNEYGYMARTDINLDAVKSAAWFYVPYPGQWGLPTVSVSSVLGMMAGVLASTMESIGDYYACARLSGAPPPPTHSINRGIAVEGVGCILASQNIAALGITRVGFVCLLIIIHITIFIVVATNTLFKFSSVVHLQSKLFVISTLLCYYSQDGLAADLHLHSQTCTLRHLRFR
uniref:Si:dkey-106n21.1 n=1 Tax=Sinocyclocheilus rhinocerous TaxID=307959 RepID=A0A673LEC2_9TELE